MSDNPDLANLRNQIDTIDEQLVHLLDERARLALSVAKAKNGGPVYRPAREEQVIKHILETSEGVLSEAALEAIYREIIAACRSVQQPLVVSYLGPEGTYTEEAARARFGTADAYLPFGTIDEVIAMVEKGGARVAVVPVENSTEGSVARTLDVLVDTPLQVVGEIMLPIHHQLLTQTANLKDITEVSAHPQALAQCRAWLDKHLPHAKRIAAASNAAAAHDAQGFNNTHRAAIASARAATVYGLPMLAKNIEDSKVNTTRFLVLGHDRVSPTGNDRTSLVCSVANKSGTLYALLSVFAEAGINMTKLESRPSPSGLWDYVFFIDIDGHIQDAAIADPLDRLHEHATFVKVLGSYPKGV